MSLYSATETSGIVFDDFMPSYYVFLYLLFLVSWRQQQQKNAVPLKNWRRTRFFSVFCCCWLLSFFSPCLRRVSVDGNSTLQLAFNDIIIYEDERQGSLADVSGCCCCVLSVVRDSLVSVGNQTFGRRDSERWENLFNGRHSRERKISSSIYSQAEQENAVEKIFFLPFPLCVVSAGHSFFSSSFVGERGE